MPRLVLFAACLVGLLHDAGAHAATGARRNLGKIPFQQAHASGTASGVSLHERAIDKAHDRRRYRLHMSWAESRLEGGWCTAESKSVVIVRPGEVRIVPRVHLTLDPQATPKEKAALKKAVAEAFRSLDESVKEAPLLFDARTNLPLRLRIRPLFVGDAHVADWKLSLLPGTGRSNVAVVQLDDQNVKFFGLGNVLRHEAAHLVFAAPDEDGEYTTTVYPTSLMIDPRQPLSLRTVFPLVKTLEVLTEGRILRDAEID